MGGRFIALRHLKTMAGPVKPGDPIPEAGNWPSHIIISEVNAGNVLDLEQVFVVNPGHQAALKRQTGLLERLKDYNRVVGPDPTDPNKLCLTILEPESENQGSNETTGTTETAPAADGATETSPEAGSGQLPAESPSVEAEPQGTVASDTAGDGAAEPETVPPVEAAAAAEVQTPEAEAEADAPVAGVTVQPEEAVVAEVAEAPVAEAQAEAPAPAPTKSKSRAKKS